MHDHHHYDNHNHDDVNDHLHSDSHSHEHEHGHEHSHIPTNQRILWLSFCIITGFMLIEAIGGKAFGSLALLADAGHMLNDSLSLALAGFAVWYGHRHANALGKKVELTFALLNGISLLAIAGWIVYEAIYRLNNPQPMMSKGVLAIAVLGLIVNLVVMRIMQGGEHDNLNMKAAYAHVLADILGSVAAIVASLCLWLFGWQWADPLASLCVALVVLKSGFAVTTQAIRALCH